nr:phage tail tape measure protein [Clostridium tetani]
MLLAKKEIYRLDIKIGVKGDDTAKKKLSATEKFAKSSEKKMKALNKIKASPSVKLNDKLSKPANKIKSKMSKLNKVKANPSVKLKDKATKPAEKIEKKTKKVDKIKAKPIVRLKDEATKPLNRIKAKLSAFSKSACSKLAAVATAGAIMIGGLGIGAAVNNFANFEQGLANVKAISGATAQEMQLLGKEAKRLGAETAWSAKDVTDAEMLLSQAGFKVQETIAALPGLLDMASAGDIQLAEATDIAAGTLRAFGIEASKSAHVADVLALTASRTNSDITGIGESMKYVAPVSKALGVSFEDTSAALGMLADANIKGSQAGTVLRAAFSRLSNPPKKAAGMIKKLGFSAFDAQGKMLPLDNVVGNLKKSLEGLTEQQKAQAVSTIFGVESMSGMLALVEQGPKKLKRLSNELQNSDGAAKKMAETRLDSLQGQFTILKSAVEGMNIELGERLAPYAKEFVTWFTAKIPDITQGIVKVVEKISSLAKKFNSLGTGTKKMFAAVAIGAVAFNPLTKAIKGTTKVLTFLIGLSPKLATFLGISKKATVAAGATKTLAAGVGLASKGVGGLGLAAKGGTALLNPWVLGLGAATYAGVKLYKHLKKDSIPEVQRFGDEISKSTQKSLGAFMDLEEKATKSLKQITWSGTNLTQDLKNNLIGDFDEMTNQITTKIDERTQKSKNSLQVMFANSKNLNDKEKQQMTSSVDSLYKTKSEKVIKGNAEIQKILNDVAAKNGQITKAQSDRILQIKSEMLTSAVEIMSESEAEQASILERMKLNSETISAEQAADIVQKSLDQKEKTIQTAREEFDERLRFAAMLRAEGGAENEKLADKVATEAEKQFKEASEKAESMHTSVVEHARLQAEEHAEQVDWETGKVKSNFDVMMDKIREFNALSIKEKVITITQKINNIFKKQNKEQGTPYRLKGKGYATGTTNATRGIHQVAEHGFEIVVGRQTRLFNGGERVLNNRESKKFLQNGFEKRNNETHKKEPSPYFAVAQPQLAGSGGNNIKVNVDMKNNFNNDDDVETIVQEAMQEFGYKLKEALKNIKK